MTSRQRARCPSSTALAASVALLALAVGCSHRTRIQAISGTGAIARNGAVQFDLSGTTACVKQQWDGNKYVWLRDVRCPEQIAKLLRTEAQGTPQLLVKTPWGDVWRAPIEKTARASFQVDWGRAGFSHHEQATRERLAGTWIIAVQGTSLAMKWSPDSNDISNAVAAIEAAIATMARTGVTPPDLRIEMFGTRNNRLRAGVRTALKLTLVNDGSGPAYGVEAVTSSTLPALDGLRFPFGKIPPGETVTRVVEVTVPREVTDFSTQVSLEFREANRHAPSKHSTRFAVVVNQCPNGKLNDAAYTQKRARLERALEAQALSKEEFEQYDTALLMCLE